MNVDKARNEWHNSGRSIVWLLAWPHQRILRLLRDLFVEYDRLLREYKRLQRERDEHRKEQAEDKRTISELEKKLTEREKKLAERDEEIREKEERIVDLEHQLSGHKKDSTNSSKPPSSDGPAAGKRTHPQRPKSKRKPGGQPGHPGRCRNLVPIEQVKQVIRVFPDSCKRCKRKFTEREKQAALQNNVHRHQVVEIPEMKSETTEYQFGSVVCCCGESNRAPIPAEIRSGSGPRLVALVSYLTVFCRMPRRKVEQLLAGALGTSIALGSTQRHVEEASQALQIPYQELEQQLRHEPVLNGDETGWRKDGEKRWLWVLVARAFAFFVVAKSRGSKVLEQILGPVFAGILCSDRFSAYIKYHKGIAQFCWAHLKRDLLGIEQLGKTTDADRFARDALALHARLFRVWHRYRGGTIDRDQLIDKAMPIEKKFFALGERYLDSKDAGVRALATLFFFHIERLFAFVNHHGVEPTNNVSERTIRTAVQWRKICFGNRSEEGEVATARLLTAAATCSIQKRNLLHYLTEAVRCHRKGLPAPSLVPTAA
jgi:transposase